MKRAKFCTDMAIEAVDNRNLGVKYGVETRKIGDYILKSKLIVKTDEQSKELAKKKGLYFTLDCNKQITYKQVQKELIVEIKNILKNMTSSIIRGNPNILVVGLGNRDMTTDALGSLVVDKLIVTRHLFESNSLTNRKMLNVAGIVTGVFGVTGIESYDIVKGVVNQISADLVIVVDTLASSRVTRLFSSFQITNAGIEPGSAMKMNRQPLDHNSLGIPVIAIGVPLALYARSILHDCLNKVEENNIKIGQNNKYEIISKILGDDNLSMILTPKNIDIAVEICADIIASGINLAFQNNIKKNKLS